MSSSIGNISSGNVQRPDFSQIQQNLFTKADADGDGTLGEDDLQNLLQSSPRLAKGLSSLVSASDGSTPTVQDIFKKMDTDGDGTISASEFKSAMSQVHANMRAHHHHGGGAAALTSAPSPDATSAADGTNVNTAADFQVLLEQMLQKIQQQQAQQNYTANGTGGSSQTSTASIFEANA
jgi:Ca2+-binding EF-hand superfamily protein